MGGTHTSNLAPARHKQEDQKFKVIVSDYRVESQPAWFSGDSLSKENKILSPHLRITGGKQNKTKQNPAECWEEVMGSRLRVVSRAALRRYFVLTWQVTTNLAEQKGTLGRPTPNFHSP